MELVSRSMLGRLFAVYLYSRNGLLATLTPIYNGTFATGTICLRRDPTYHIFNAAI